jgi:hypothetical protein
MQQIRKRLPTNHKYLIPATGTSPAFVSSLSPSMSAGAATPARDKKSALPTSPWQPTSVPEAWLLQSTAPLVADDAFAFIRLLPLARNSNNRKTARGGLFR